MLMVAVAHSDDPDTTFACEELLEQSEASISGWEPAAAVLLAAIDYDHQQLLDAILGRWPELRLIGCTTDGEMSSVKGFQQDTASLVLFGGEDVGFYTSVGRGVSDSGAIVGAAAVQQAAANTEAEIKLCMAFPEALGTNGVEILSGIKSQLGNTVPVFGGLSADQWRFRKTYQFFGHEVLTDSVSVLLFTGNIVTGHGIASGWQPVGRSGVVTKSVGSDVHEIDGAPALDFYRSYLGDKEPSSQYPLAIFVDAGNYYLRAPSGQTDVDAGVVSFFADVPEGATVQMTEATRDDIVAATRFSMKTALSSYAGGKPAAALFVSCASRRQILGTKTGTEVQGAASCIAENLPYCGFYANGEIGPYSGSTVAHFHNETFVTLLIGSAKA